MSERGIYNNDDRFFDVIHGLYLTSFTISFNTIDDKLYDQERFEFGSDYIYLIGNKDNISVKDIDKMIQFLVKKTEKYLPKSIQSLILNDPLEVMDRISQNDGEVGIIYSKSYAEFLDKKYKDEYTNFLINEGEKPEIIVLYFPIEEITNYKINKAYKYL